MARRRKTTPIEPEKVTKPVEEQDVMKTENGELVDGINEITVEADKNAMPEFNAPENKAVQMDPAGLAGERPITKPEIMNPDEPEGTEGTEGTKPVAAPQPKEESYDDILKSFEDLHRSRLAALEQEDAVKTKQDADAQLYGGLTEVLASMVNLAGTAHGAKNQAFTSQQDKFYERARNERLQREARREKYTSALQNIRMQRAQLRASNALKQQELALRAQQQDDLNKYRQSQLEIQAEKADAYQEYQIARAELTQKQAELKELEKEYKKAQTNAQRVKTQTLIDKTKKDIEKYDATIKDIQTRTALNKSRRDAQEIENQQKLNPDHQLTLPTEMTVDDEFEV